MFELSKCQITILDGFRSKEKLNLVNRMAQPAKIKNTFEIPFFPCYFLDGIQKYISLIPFNGPFYTTNKCPIISEKSSTIAKDISQNLVLFWGGGQNCLK